LFLLSGFLICYAVGWYIELKNQKFWWFQQVVGIPMGRNCVPLLADLFLYSCESEFLQTLVKDKKIHEARAFNFTYRYIDEFLWLKALRIVSFKRVFNLSCGRVVYRVEKSKVLMVIWQLQTMSIINTFKERYIAGSSTCSTKELSIHLTKILSAVKEGQQKTFMNFVWKICGIVA
jgi:hypothetical protein